MLFHVSQGPAGVEHKGAAFLDAFKNVVLGHIGGLVAGDVVGLGNKVGGLDGLFAEAQMRNGEAAGLFGVVGKVGLGVEVGVVADDLHSLLVGAHGAVRAEAEELALHGAGGHGVDFFFHIREVLVTSSLMPTVKWFLGCRPSMLSNTALAMPGVKSLEPRP